MILLNGKEISDKIKDELRCEVESFTTTPYLVDISVDASDETLVYINNKKKACEYVGISFMHIAFNSDNTEEEIISKIEELNNDKNINGIIVQLPIPEKYNKNKILNTINYLKDVDGLTNTSVGKRNVNEDAFIPCTPKGILEILKYYNISLESKHVVVVGRSNLVGKPIMLECLKKNATCTICHSKTKNLSFYTKQADILIVATGKKYLINKDMIKDNSVIIDVGINVEDGKLYGDVNPDVDEICAFKTPVPKGVGPMTVVMLLKNTIDAYKLQNGVKNE